PMCRDRLRALYCVNTRIWRRSLLMQLDNVKSMMRYRPPNGTAGLARSRVNGSNRVPFPPARIKVNTTLTNEFPQKLTTESQRTQRKNSEKKKIKLASDTSKGGMIFSAFSVFSSLCSL